MYQQLWGYKVEKKLYLGVSEQKRLNTTDLDDLGQFPMSRTYFLFETNGKHQKEVTLLKHKKFWEELIHLFPYIRHLFEVLEPNLMKLNLSELTLISLNSI
jgi:hypothetical protein